MDAEPGQGLDHRMGFLHALVDGSSHGSVVFEGLEGVVGQRVHRVGADQLVDVQRVGIVGFLVEVDAQSGRCTRAPRSTSASQRGPLKVCRNNS